MTNLPALGPFRDHPDISLMSIGAEEWMAFLQGAAESNIFHHPAWAAMLAGTYGFRPFVLAVRRPGGGIEAGVPLMVTTGWFAGPRWLALPFSDHCRPVSLSPAALGRLVEGLAALPSQTGIGRVEVRDGLLPHAAFHPRAEYVLHVASLPPDCNEFLGRIQSMHRRNIATAEKRGVRIVRGEGRDHLREFYRLHVITRRDQGIPVQPWRFFDRLGREVLGRGLGFILLAYSEGDCLAGAVFLHWQKTLTYKYGASRPEGLPLRPNNLIFWNALRWACENGFSRLDLGRTSLDNEGLRRFKSGWGAEEQALIYVVTPAAPGRPFRSRVTPFMKRMIRRSPRWVCRAAGELFYSQFP